MLNHIGKTTASNGLWSSKQEAMGLSLRITFKRADFGMSDDPDSDQPPRFGDLLTLMLEMQAIRQ